LRGAVVRVNEHQDYYSCDQGRSLSSSLFISPEFHHIHTFDH
jgi:hypothetical protein